MTPYWNQTFFGWFITFFSRIPEMLRGHILNDEVQVLTLICIGIAASCIGTFLILKKMSMIANALSHTILLGLVIAYLIVGAEHHFQINGLILLIAALVTSFLTSFAITGLHRGLGVQEDASIGIVFTLFFALGIAAISLFTRNAHIGVEVIMGNADALSIHDLWIAAGLLVFNLGITALLFREYLISSFDTLFAAKVGISIFWIESLITLQTSATVVGSLRAVGVVLVLALLVGPPLIARVFAKSTLKILILSALIAVFVSLCAVALARHCLSVYDLPLSTGGILVSLLLGLFALSHFWAAQAQSARKLSTSFGEMGT